MSDAPEDKKAPPPGVLAEQALGALPQDNKPAAYRDPKLDTPSPAALPVDPNYTEPYSHAAFKEMADKITKERGDAADSNTSLERKTLIDFLLARVQVLESALMPFALSAMVMSNSRMCLIADGRPEEPAGGTWISNVPSGIQLQPNEGFFFNACDAMGRTRTTEHMAAVLKKIQDAAALQAEKDSHVEAGGKVH